MEQIRILGIAPYEGMKTLMERIAPEYENMALTVFVGDLNEGVRIAQSNFHADYDVIVSRGGTAQLLRSLVELPVVEVDISVYDLLRTLKLMEGVRRRFAVVGFPAVTANAHILNELFQYDMKICSIQSQDQVLEVLEKLRADGYESILCDMITSKTARQLGMEAVLIVSGDEGIRAAFQNALQLCANVRRLREENRFLRDLLNGQQGQTAVFNADGRFYFSTGKENLGESVLEMLRAEVEDTPPGADRRMLKSIDRELYTIRAQRLLNGHTPYVAFYYTHSKATVNAKSGLQISSFREAEQTYLDSFYSVTGSMREMEPTLRQYDQSGRPIILIGEPGTGKEPAAMGVFISGSWKDRPLVLINGALLNERSLDFLENHHNSPLFNSKGTLIFKNLPAIPADHRRRLLAVISDATASKRCRILLTVIAGRDGTISEAERAFMEELSALSVRLPPLRAKRKDVPAILNLYLNQLSVSVGCQVVGAERAALELLQGYDWPHNYSQFKRIVTEVALKAKGALILASDVAESLSVEQGYTLVSQKDQALATPLDLTCPLEEIQREIVDRVLAEMGGNQSAAAARLGIGRTTLWRMLGKKQKKDS